jgi:hypothetical protein
MRTSSLARSLAHSLVIYSIPVDSNVAHDIRPVYRHKSRKVRGRSMEGAANNTTLRSVGGTVFVQEYIGRVCWTHLQKYDGQHKWNYIWQVMAWDFHHLHLRSHTKNHYDGPWENWERRKRECSKSRRLLSCYAHPFLYIHTLISRKVTKQHTALVYYLGCYSNKFSHWFHCTQ